MSFFSLCGNNSVNGEVHFQACKQACLFAVERLHVAVLYKLASAAMCWWDNPEILMKIEKVLPCAF